MYYQIFKIVLIAFRYANSSVGVDHSLCKVGHLIFIDCPYTNLLKLLIQRVLLFAVTQYCVSVHKAADHCGPFLIIRQQRVSLRLHVNGGLSTIIQPYTLLAWDYMPCL